MLHYIRKFKCQIQDIYDYLYVLLRTYVYDLNTSVGGTVLKQSQTRPGPAM